MVGIVCMPVIPALGNGDRRIMSSRSVHLPCLKKKKKEQKRKTECGHSVYEVGKDQNGVNRHS
jgi:hypothetical protein